MEIQIHQYSNRKWGFEIVSGNGHVLAQPTTMYAHKKGAKEAANSVAAKKLKVVEA